jgi:hypothetical protein
MPTTAGTTSLAGTPGIVEKSRKEEVLNRRDSRGTDSNKDSVNNSIDSSDVVVCDVPVVTLLLLLMLQMILFIPGGRWCCHCFWHPYC